MRFVIEFLLCGFFLTQTLVNIVRGMDAWVQWGDLSAQSWRDEYAQRFCARTRAAELNFAAARAFWASRIGEVDEAFQTAWGAWQETLFPYEELGIHCDEEAYVAKKESNSSIPDTYPNWVVRYEP